MSLTNPAASTNPCESGGTLAIVMRPFLMPRFYFNLRNDISVDDQEGRDFPDIATARQNAILEARQMASEQVQKGRLNLNHSIEVTDETGAVVDTIYFAEAVGMNP